MMKDTAPPPHGAQQHLDQDSKPRLPPMAPKGAHTPKERDEEALYLSVKASQHDTMQLELSTTFDLAETEGASSRSYFTDIYMFIPISMGINSSTYDTNAFFRARMNYFRLRTPKMHNWREKNPEEFRLESAENYFADHLTTATRKRFGPAVIKEAKLLGNYLHTRLKNMQRKVGGLRALRGETRGKARRRIKDRLTRNLTLIKTYRERYLIRHKQEGLLLEKDVLGALLLTDEYVSYRIELLLLKLKLTLTHVDDQELADLVERELQAEMVYREEQGYLVLNASQSRLELYTYRLGLLKKFVSETLFLTTKSAKRDKLYRNGVAAIGAALAALVAGLARHHRLQYATNNDTGWRFWLIIFMAVAAYVFKDRVKDLTKEHFNTRLKHKLPDFRVSLDYSYTQPNGDKKSYHLGFAQEYIKYLKESELPPDVLYVRSLGQRASTDPARNEVVLHMARQFDFNLVNKQSIARHIKNVMRYDFAAFLAKLDDPDKLMHYYDPKLGPQVGKAPKVYHLNLVLRHMICLPQADGKEVRKIRLQRIRVILNKRGLVRLESVVDFGELKYERTMIS